MAQANIATEERAMTITAEVKAQAPILGLINTDLKSEFGSESGDTVSALIPGFGQVGEGVALTGNTDDWKLSIQKVPITISPKNIPASYDFVDASVRIGNFDEKVGRPYGSHLASHIRREAFDAIIGGATKAFIANINATDSTAFKFSKVSEAISTIRDANLGGQIGCVLSNRLKAALTASGLNQFQNGSVAFDLWKGKINNFDGADFVAQSEVLKVKVPTGLGTLTVASAVSEGAKQIVLNAASTAAGTVIPKGYVFTVQGINSVDIFKKDDGNPRAFVVLKNATISAANGTFTLDIEPIYAAAPQAQTSALRNATALPSSGNTVNKLLTAEGKTYHAMAIFDQNSTGYASAAIKEPPGADSSVSTVDGYVNVRMTAQFNVTSGLSIVRFDILTGGKSLYPQGVAGMWVQVD